jgi:hypothetical protein
MSALRRFVATYPVTIYVVAAWVVHAAIVATQHYEIRNHGLSLLRIFTPAIIALTVTMAAEGRAAVIENLASLFRFKVSPKYYAFALSIHRSWACSLWDASAWSGPSTTSTSTSRRPRDFGSSA